MQGLRQGSEGKTKGVLILSASWGGNSSQLCLSEIGAKGKVEEWSLRKEEKLVGESSKNAFALFIPQCAVMTLKNSERCMN